jgi:hypothetical protein
MTCHPGTFCPLAGVASKVSLTLEPITALPGAVPGRWDRKLMPGQLSSAMTAQLPGWSGCSGAIGVSYSGASK